MLLGLLSGWKSTKRDLSAVRFAIFLQILPRYFSAKRYAGRYVVTLSVDQVIFREPIHVGELVTFLASVNYTGRTSMEVGVKVMTENIHERTVRHTNSCFFTMVAMDDQRRPVAVRPLEPETAIEKRRYAQALARREQRKLMELRYQEIREQVDHAMPA